MLPQHRQAAYGVRFERGESGLRALAEFASVVIIVDVLSFSTAVDVATSRGALVRAACFENEEAVRVAAACGALLGVPKSRRSERSPYSLSPRSLTALQAGARLVIPSPNGATLMALAEHETKARIVFGCLRNASSVAAFARAHAGARPIAVIAAGERWPDGTLRPALEDDLGAGAIIAEINRADASPEARYVAEGFLQFRRDIVSEIEQTVSGRELIEDGYADDVAFAAALGASRTVPLLCDDGFIRSSIAS